MDDAAIRSEVIALAQELIRIDTSNPPGRERAAAQLLRSYLEAAGVDCELTGPDPGRPNLVARIPGSGDGPSLALCGHTDVVPADAEDWQHPPFAGHVDDDGWLWGRGAVDMKNETASRCAAVAMLARDGFRPRGDLVLICQSDEEDGRAGVGMRWLVPNRPDLRVDYAIDEGAGARLELPDGRVLVTIETGQKATLPVRVTALGEAAHASTPHMGANAVTRLATLVSRVAAYRPRRRLLPATERMLATAVGGADGDLDAAIARACELHAFFAGWLPALYSTTMAPTRLEGSHALNVIPGRASVEVDCRVLPGTTAAELEAELREALGDDLPYELAWTDALTGGAQSPIDTPLYEACRSFVDVHDPGAELMPVISTGFADSNYLREGWGTIAYGFWPFRTTPIGVVDEGMHNRDERIHVDDLVYGTKAQLHVVRSLLG